MSYKSLPAEHRKIGYLAPEFPGQTHLFLWREIQALAAIGISCQLLSTRRPPAGIVCHSWSEEAQQMTTYLAPLGFSDSIGILAQLLRAGPARLLRCLSLVCTSPGLAMATRFELVALLAPSAKLARIARQNGLRHVHVASCANAANIAMFASILSGISYSLSLLGPTLEGYGPNQHNKWRRAAFAIVMSQRLYRTVQQRLRGSLPELVEVAPVGVDLNAIRRAGSYVPWNASGHVQIYSCGRLNFVKGHADLITAVSMLRAKGVDARLIIAGEDEQGGAGYRRELEKIIAERDARDFVNLLGAVSEEAHRDQLAAAHVFALASLDEGISVAIMEAMAMETPVVATDVGGNSELIDDGVDGILVSSRAPEEFADALEKIVRDPVLALHLSEQSRKKIAAKFHSGISAQALAKCLAICQQQAEANPK